MQVRERFREMLLSLAAGQAMIPLGDNRRELGRFAQRVWQLRAAEAARLAAADRANARSRGAARA
jgi:hypothetical protein